MINRLVFGSLITLFISCNYSIPNHEQELNLSWQFSESGTENWLPAVVPGSIQEDLLQNKKILDPFRGLNEDSIQWVESSYWTYTSSLMISEELLSYNHLELIFKGLDTYAKVFINDNLVIETNNMFLEYQFDIRKLVKKGSNQLRIEFEPPVHHNRSLIDSMTFELPSSETAPIKVSSVTRKAAYQFGWDFAPRILTMGIWKPVLLQTWNDIKIRDVHYSAISITDSLAIYHYQYLIDSRIEADFELDLNRESKKIHLVQGQNIITDTLRIEKPKFWWPNGMGAPHLYNIVSAIRSNGKSIEVDTTKLGVRTIELIQEEDEIGTSFRFKVNGEKVFIKGANWSPMSSYPGSITDSTYVNRLNQVKEAHMNMLRVWGGGIYESDLFYDLCDENGILVWQDFMFANTMYPPTKTFIDNVEDEVHYQVKRLRNHPSIAHWNGNNEIDVAWKNWGWQNQYGYTDADSAALWENYLEIFDNLIPSILLNLDSSVNYTTTSPLSNWGKTENFNHGSMHYWGVWHGQDRIEAYHENVGRFVSEYGFQSFPSMETIRTYYKKDGFSSEMDNQLHQKSYVGTQLILSEAERFFGPSKTLEEFVYKSQLTQAMAYKTAIEAHRLADKCDGTLFWQLNDCWPGPSWSIIDVYGRKKIAFEVVKDRYKPNILISKNSGDDLEVFLIREQKSLDSAIIELELINATGEVIWTQQKDIVLHNQQKILIYKSDTKKVLDGFSDSEVTLKSTLIINNKVEDIDYTYFTQPKNFKGRVDLIGLL